MIFAAETDFELSPLTIAFAVAGLVAVGFVVVYSCFVPASSLLVQKIPLSRNYLSFTRFFANPLGGEGPG